MQQDGCNTQDGGMTKRCRVKPGFHIVVSVVSVVSVVRKKFVGQI